MASSGWHRKNPNTAAEQARRAKYRGSQSREHRAARKHWTAVLAQGAVLACWRCGGAIHQGTRWVVGHDDIQVTLIRGPEHHACNSRAANSKGARVANAKRKAQRQPLKPFTRPQR